MLLTVTVKIRKFIAVHRFTQQPVTGLSLHFNSYSCTAVCVRELVQFILV